MVPPFYYVLSNLDKQFTAGNFSNSKGKIVKKKLNIIIKISVILIILIIVFTILQKFIVNQISSFHIHYLSMTNTNDLDKFYPKMNQVEATHIEVLEKPKRILIEFETNTLNFDHYEIIANDEKKILKILILIF